RSDLELLISARGAEREGRPLGADETAARQAYAAAVQRHGRGAGVGLQGTSPSTLTIKQAIIRVLAEPLSADDLSLASKAYQAAEQGVELSADEGAALQTYTASLLRLCQQAGFASIAEFEQFDSSTEIAEGLVR